MKYILLSAISIFSLSVFAQEPYVLKGKFSKKTNATKIYAQHRLGEEFVKDSAEIKNGRFTLQGKLDEPGLLYLSLKRNEVKANRSDMLQVFIEPGTFNIRIADSLKTGNLTGSAAYTDYKMMESMAKPANDKLAELYKQYDVLYKAKEKSKMQEMDKQIESLQNGELANAYLNFIEKNPNSLLTLTALERYAGYDIDFDKIYPIWQKLSTAAKNSKSGLAYAKKLDIAKLTKIGAPAIMFTQNDPNGKPINLADFKGKYVLIDFWASWCGPCRAENPNVVSNYNKFKAKNFTVLGVSLDRENQKDRWIKAIADDQLDWAHVSDLKFWQNEVAQMYGINAIPQNLLIDPNGIIIAKNLREERLGEKLAALLGE